MNFVIFLLLIISISANSHTFKLAEDDFLLDGKPFQIISGAFHYFRV